MNRLLGYERAIVSNLAGTTRDTIEETANIRGIPIRLIDTAGIREVDDIIEGEGVARAKKEGKYSGRVPTVRKKRNVIAKLHKQGMKPSQIAKELNIGIASVYRYREVA